ncbi:MAG: hypothetical protein OHK0052_04420 [Anaerolineales bacterium]
MNIRSITLFFEPDAQPVKQVRDFAPFIAAARAAFEQAGYTVQTTRLASTPFVLWLPSDLAAAVAIAQTLEQAAQAQGFAYVSLGPALPSAPWGYDLIPQVLARTQNTFFSGVVADADGISFAAVQACARVVSALAGQQPNGFGNLYFAALANVGAGAPFFPAAYHAPGKPPSFALALEAADVALAAFEGAPNLEMARARLLADMAVHSQKLVAVAEGLQAQFGARFGGLDFTPAPFPEKARSLGAALEALGVPALGGAGGVAAAAFLAETLDLAQHSRCGFNGLMLPVLEDAILAQRAAEGLLTLNDLLLYSAVCGTGLDTIPLPGDAAADSLAAVLLDVAALSARLRKPLTARLMPIPGKAAGDETNFAFDYFANSRVMALPPARLLPPLGVAQTWRLQPRP